MRKVVRRGKGEGEGQEFIIDGQQEADELDADAEQFMGYAVLARESKVGFWAGLELGFLSWTKLYFTLVLGKFSLYLI